MFNSLVPNVSQVWIFVKDQVRIEVGSAIKSKLCTCNPQMFERRGVRVIIDETMMGDDRHIRVKYVLPILL